MNARVTRFGSVVLATCAELGTVEAMAAQGESPDAQPGSLGDGRQSLTSVTLEGFVLAPDGSLDRALDGIGEVVSFTVTATDDLDPSPVVVCVPPSGSTFPRGTTVVSCTATDVSGKRSEGQFPVTVVLEARRR